MGINRIVELLGLLITMALKKMEWFFVANVAREWFQNLTLVGVIDTAVLAVVALAPWIIAWAIWRFGK